jgi:putative membrane-bound dehydrogenase-like protein
MLGQAREIVHRAGKPSRAGCVCLPNILLNWTTMPHLPPIFRALSGLIAIGLLPGSLQAAESVKPEAHLKVLFLGDQGIHKPAERLRDAAPAMLDRGIDLVYTEDLGDLNRETLALYPAIIIYANHTKIAPEAEQALLDYLANGGGLVALHSATNCFGNSKKFIELVGARFKSHGAGVMTDEIAAADHPLLSGYKPFESWDETRVHGDHNATDRVVLTYHKDKDKEPEPWTWVRTHEKGRVFYTSWGHDERTWRNPGFHDLLERAILWCSGKDVAKVLSTRELNQPYEDAPVENYPPPVPEIIRKQGLDEKAYSRQPKPISPQASMQRMIVPAGFRVELFAAEPDVVNPIAMAWDERGRLWTVETVDYPHNTLAGKPGHDKIRILEDTDNDGRADKVTVFADDLNIPTCLTFHDGGVIVMQAPHTLFLKDTDGDDKADVRTVLVDGWSQRDTHGGPNNIRYGLDNKIWGTVGMAGFKGTVGREEFPWTNNQIFRLNQQGTQLELVQRLSNNSWGLGLSEEGLVFAATANAQPTNYSPIAQRYFAKVPALKAGNAPGISPIGPRYLPVTNMIRQNNVHGGFTAAGGHALYTARSFPKEYWNRTAFITELTGHLVGSFALTPDGSSFSSFNKMNLIASDDQWFSPVAAEVGPDGAVWIADLYEYITQHMVPGRPGSEHGGGAAYVTGLRDKSYGRIYRVVWEGAKPHQPLALRREASAELVRTLTHDNMLWRSHAQRLLVERANQDVVPELLQLVADPAVDEIGLNPGAIHALWTLHGLGALDGSNPAALAAAATALRHPSPGVRRNALQVLPPTAASRDAILAANLLSESDVQVRLAALLALSEMPADAATGTALAASLAAKDDKKNRDESLADAAAIAASQHSVGFLAAGPMPGSMAAKTAETLAAQPEQADGTPADARVINLGVVVDMLKFDTGEITAKAGEKIRILFTNTDKLEHNLVILKPGSLAKVGALADAMVNSPDARQRNYVPDSPDVLFRTPVVNPADNATLSFTAPDKPGNYPFACLVPGHWRAMQGILVVK